MVLAGIRVLDVGSYVAGPAAATMMGDFGAEVIVNMTIMDPVRCGSCLMASATANPSMSGICASRITSENGCGQGKSEMPAHLLLGHADHLLARSLRRCPRWSGGQDPGPIAILDEDERGARVYPGAGNDVRRGTTARSRARPPPGEAVRSSRTARGARGDPPLDGGSAADRRDHPAGAERRSEQAGDHERPGEGPVGSIRLAAAPHSAQAQTGRGSQSQVRARFRLRSAPRGSRIIPPITAPGSSPRS